MKNYMLNGCWILLNEFNRSKYREEEVIFNVDYDNKKRIQLEIHEISCIYFNYSKNECYKLIVGEDENGFVIKKQLQFDFHTDEMTINNYFDNEQLELFDNGQTLIVSGAQYKLYQQLLDENTQLIDFLNDRFG